MFMLTCSAQNVKNTTNVTNIECQHEHSLSTFQEIERQSSNRISNTNVI